MICLFLAYVWKTGNALEEIEYGFPGARNSLFGKLWPIFVKVICPILILIVFITTLVGMF
jgi:NSS family neurotransmitter:Na+ symporter